MWALPRRTEDAVTQKPDTGQMSNVELVWYRDFYERRMNAAIDNRDWCRAAGARAVQKLCIAELEHRGYPA